jgi:hypothetical protein
MARPLTKTAHQGNLYTRSPSVEAAIDGAIGRDLETLSRHAAIADRLSPEFLPLECLVHLIRDALRRGDEDMTNALLQRLLGRCDAILRKKIPADIAGDWDEVRAEILGDLAVLFVEDATDGKHKLDFFECRFNLAFRTFRIPYLKEEIARSRGRVYALPDSGEQRDLGDDRFLSELAAKFRDQDPPVDLALRQSISNAMDTLPFDQCKAVMLVYYQGLPIESEDPSVTTAATVCGVTGRAIRYRLSKALETLSTKFQTAKMKEMERGNANDLESPRDTAR